MKNKIFKSLFFSLTFLVITGCGVITHGEPTSVNKKDENKDNNVTTCTLESDATKITIEFTTDKNDEFKKLKRTFRTTAPNKEELEEAYQSYKLEVEKMNTYDGISAKTSRNGLELSITYEIDFNKVTTETSELIDLNEYDNTGNKFRKELETDGGYTCK